MEAELQSVKEPVWTILPSYDMYQYTFCGISGPPEYEVTSGPHTIGHNSGDRTGSTEPSDDTRVINSISSNVAIDRGRESVLKNINDLTSLPYFYSSFESQIHLSVHFTQDAGKSGITQNPLDLGSSEYSQGDYLNGYILIRNISKDPIPFDIFYVLFEGSYHCKSKLGRGKTAEVVTRRFLQMFDFAASWNQSRVERLITTDQKENRVCPDLIDKSDGSLLCISGRKLKPDVLYKRFFTFKIPNYLLTTGCDHDLPSHMVLPPTLGHCENNKDDSSSHIIKDFAFTDSSIRYNVSARFIGKQSHYSQEFVSTHSSPDVFVVFKECNFPVRLVPHSNAISNVAANIDVLKTNYRKFVDTIEECIKLGKRIERASSGGTLGSQAIKASFQGSKHCDPQDLKATQLYNRPDTTEYSFQEFMQPKDYVISIPVSKKGLLGGKRTKGTITVRFPRIEHILDYMPPKQFTKRASHTYHRRKIEIRFEVSYESMAPSSAGVPQILEISTELIVTSIKAARYPIPVEFDRDQFFQNSFRVINENKSSDHFGNIMIGPMRKYSYALNELLSTLKKDQFEVDGSLLTDIYALAGLEARSFILVLRNSRIAEDNGRNTSVESHQPVYLIKKEEKFISSFMVIMDVNQAQIKGKHSEQVPENYSSIDEFCLVPNFQNCNLARMYHLQIGISFSTGQKVELKLPVTVVKSPTS